MHQLPMSVGRNICQSSKLDYCTHVVVTVPEDRILHSFGSSTWSKERLVRHRFTDIMGYNTNRGLGCVSWGVEGVGENHCLVHSRYGSEK